MQERREYNSRENSVMAVMSKILVAAFLCFYGISFEKETGEQEAAADKFAEDCLIPPEEYKSFISNKRFSLQDIKGFANQIERDPGIVLGRLQNDGYVGFDDWTMSPLRHKYKVKMSV